MSAGEKPGAITTQSEAVNSLIEDAARAQELFDPDELEEFARDHRWGCGYCDGTVVSMGFLGNREHGRCRDCGMDQNRMKDEDEECTSTSAETSSTTSQ